MIVTPALPAGSSRRAEDVATFGRMILAGGQLNGRRYLSESAVRQMTSTQTGTLIAKMAAATAWPGRRHARTAAPPLPGLWPRRAYANDLLIDPQSGLVMVFMVQQAGGFVGVEGNPVLPAFRKAAVAAFGK